MSFPSYKELTLEELNQIIDYASSQFYDFILTDDGKSFVLNQTEIKDKLSNYKHFIVPSFDSKYGDLIELWTKENADKEEQYANCDTLYISKPVLIKDLLKN